MKLTSCTSLILLSAASSFADADSLSFADTDTFELVQQSSLEQCFPSSIPWVNYKGNDYIFSREQYNSICVDNKGKQYEWGAIQGVYPSIATKGGGCSNFCVKGYGRAEAKGCSSSQRPNPNKLVGFDYDCDKATCYCLYEKDTLSSKYEKCFDSMDRSNKGSGDIARTTTKQGTTCYSLQIQPSDPQPRTPTRKPTKKPSPTPRGQSICVRSPDYKCYKSGRPQCCSKNNGKDCPKEMTMCDNHPEGMGGWNYCTQSPDYKCYKDGRPSCCAKNSLDCPREKPSCDKKPPQPRTPTRKPTKKPSPTPRGQSICVRSPDYKCYKSGRPQCCSKNNGKDCPKEMTMCDNHPEGMTGWSYCTQAPDFDCYKDGRPSCCAKNSLDCPQKQPKCDRKKSTEELASQRFLRSMN